ncbi:MAG TPA: 3'-5' exonuclease [Cytophagaceae bacterium]|jgi:predicted PolB exonuclease-like 3'-5' exonuclease|nr:3'-5' exonuclease [Cytophagaceae bacterium]
MDKKLKNLLFLDIETVPNTEHYADMDERLKPLWDKKASYLDREHPPEQIYQRAGIYAEFGKIITISVGFFFEEGSLLHFKVKSFAGDDERLILKDFVSMLDKSNQKKLLLCAHNGKEFDFPYLCRRMIIHDIALPEVLDISGKKPWETPYIDTLELWKFGDRKSYCSLELLATILNVPTGKEGFDGSMVSGMYYKDKDLKTIVEYCVRDVIMTAQIYLRFKNLPIISGENILII